MIIYSYVNENNFISIYFPNSSYSAACGQGNATIKGYQTRLSEDYSISIAQSSQLFDISVNCKDTSCSGYFTIQSRHHFQKWIYYSIH